LPLAASSTPRGTTLRKFVPEGCSKPAGGDGEWTSGGGVRDEAAVEADPVVVVAGAALAVTVSDVLSVELSLGGVGDAFGCAAVWCAAEAWVVPAWVAETCVLET